MNPDKKPEWFEMTESDNAPQIRKVTKSIPVSAIVAVALVLGAGAVVGQPGNQSAVTSIASPELSVQVAQSAQQETVAKPTSSLKNPSIAQLPVGENDDDEYEDEEDDEYEDEDEEEDDD